MRILLTAGTLVLPDFVLADPWLLIDDGTIHSFGTRGDGLPQHQEHQDLPGALLRRPCSISTCTAPPTMT